MASEKITAVPFEEIELKLCLPCADSSILEPLLVGLPLLAHCKARREHLHNIYFDTPDDLLNRQRTALRLRRIGNAEQPVWLQTLKMGGNGDSALSQRGEWETPVSKATLEFGMLEATPWVQMDPDGSLMRALTPRFTTDFTRTLWTIRNRDDASVVEIALDRGHIDANGQNTPICELELELKAGEPSALFAIARQIASALAVMPLAASKAQRGFALANHTLDQPTRARPPDLSPEMSQSEAARCVLRDVLHHFSANLHTLLTSDDPEVVHQTRIAWRRMKAALSVFRKTPLVQDAPTWHASEAFAGWTGALARSGSCQPANLAHARQCVCWRKFQTKSALACPAGHVGAGCRQPTPMGARCTPQPERWRHIAGTDRMAGNQACRCAIRRHETQE
jgi:inorganic triphosphatase YgiF